MSLFGTGRIERWPLWAFTVLSLLGCASNQHGAQVSHWNPSPSMTHARAAHAVASSSSGIYAIAGTNADGRPVTTVEKYDGRAWHTLSALPPGLEGGLNAPAAAVLGDSLFVSGGFSSTSNRPVADLWALNLLSLAWTRLASMPAPRGGHAMAVVRGRLHVVGGGNDRRTLEDHVSYDPATNTWQARSPLPRSKGSPAAVVVQDRLAIVGGRSGREDLGDVHWYDEPKDQWVPLHPIEPRGTAGAVVHCGRVFLIGGESQAQQRVLNRVESISEERLFSGEPWQAESNLPTPRAFARSVVFGGKIHVVGGAVAYGASHEAIGTSTVESLEFRCNDRH